VIVLDPVDSSAGASLVNLAQSQGVKVIAYDRPIPEKLPTSTLSFDNKGIGKLLPEKLWFQHLEKMGVPKKTKGGILQINGSPTGCRCGVYPRWY